MCPRRPARWRLGDKDDEGVKKGVLAELACCPAGRRGYVTPA